MAYIPMPRPSHYCWKTSGPIWSRCSSKRPLQKTSANRLEIFHNQLQIAAPTKLVDVNAVGDAHSLHLLIRPLAQLHVEGNGVEQELPALAAAQHHLQMFTAHEALLHHMELAIKQRLGKVLPPGACIAQGLSQYQRQLIFLQTAVADDFRLQIFRS